MTIVMINDHTLSRFHSFGSQLVRPVYQDYAFANLPATLQFLLTGERTGLLLPPDCFGGSYPSPKRIVLFFIDSFGWSFWQRYAQHSPIMRNVMEGGVLTPISALFPSTTAASVSTLNLGKLPADHAVYEWNMYVPAYGETIQSLAFSTFGHHAVPCGSKGFDINDLIVGRETLHHRLARHDVRSIQLSHRNYANSSYNRIASSGAEVIPHASLPEALVQLRDILDGPSSSKMLINLYWAGLDTAAHFFGPGSSVHDAEVRSFWATLDTLLADLHTPDTLFLFTADHGHVGLDAAHTLYINERWPDFVGCLAISPTGQTIWPNGSPRDMFLHLRADRRADVCAALAERLADIAEVLPMERAVSEGLFGPAPISAELRARLGDVLVLPHPGHFIWWRERGIVDNRLHGHHGGLSAEEMITVLGVTDQL